LLISKLGAKWQSYKKYLKMNEAIAFPTSDTEEYNTYTIAKAMNCGWAWNIPTYGRWGNGYIFDSNYINAEQAKDEMEKTIGKKIEIGRHIKFDPGCLDTPWIKNCLAVGLSANFVEPLEATSIGTSINQMFLFTQYFSNYNEQSIDDYNNKMSLIMNNIRDFIVLHYITKREDTEFWKDLKKIELPDTLKTNLERWQTRLPILEDFKGTNYYLFFENNFTQVLYGLGLLNIKNLKNTYDNLNITVKKDLNIYLKEYFERYNNPTIGHKQYLNIIRNTNA
jgi:tryptophan halogenase